MKIGKFIPSMFLLLLLLGASRSAQPSQTDASALEWGNPVDGVQISLRFASAKTGPSNLPEIELAIRNRGAVSRKITLGGGCGPITPGWKTAWVILIITDLQGRSQKLQDVPGPPLLASCAGALGVFAVDVAPGATTSAPLDLDCYYASDVRFEYGWAGGGRYSLRAELGSLESNELRVQFAGNAPSRRCFSGGLVVPCADK
jgi:hypothetical protein